LEEEKERGLLKEIMPGMEKERQKAFFAKLLEAVEDAGLMAAILEGESSEKMSREEIDAILEGRGKS
jgi:hypothetical protein